MIVQIITASKHGSTREIGEVIADELRAAGLDTRLAGIDEVDGLEDAGAVVLGSAVYVGNWMGEARDVVDRHAGDLAERPVYLFSSGPVGGTAGKPEQIDTAKLDEIVEKTGAREHVIFGGNLDKSKLGLGERLITRVVRAPQGDFRDWDAIRDWARHIAAELAG